MQYASKSDIGGAITGKSIDSEFKRVNIFYAVETFCKSTRIGSIWPSRATILILFALILDFKILK